MAYAAKFLATPSLLRTHIISCPTLSRQVWHHRPTIQLHPRAQHVTPLSFQQSKTFSSKVRQQEHGGMSEEMKHRMSAMESKKRDEILMVTFSPFNPCGLRLLAVPRFGRSAADGEDGDEGGVVKKDGEDGEEEEADAGMAETDGEWKVEFSDLDLLLQHLGRVARLWFSDGYIV